MHFFRQAGAVSVVFAFAAANPISSRLAGGQHSFIVYQTVPKSAAVSSAYRRYNATFPYRIKSVAAIDDTTAEAVPDSFELEYLTLVTIGGQDVHLDFDTGSTGMYVKPEAE